MFIQSSGDADEDVALQAMFCSVVIQTAQLRLKVVL